MMQWTAERLKDVLVGGACCSTDQRPPSVPPRPWMTRGTARWKTQAPAHTHTHTHTHTHAHTLTHTHHAAWGCAQNQEPQDLHPPQQVPWYAVLGNHDHGSFNDANELVVPCATTQLDSCPRDYFSPLW